MKLEIKHFKNELSDYSFLQSKISRISEAILEIDTRRGLHAVRYDREAVQGSPDPLAAELSRLDEIDRREWLQGQLEVYMGRLEHIMEFVRSSELGDSVFLIHCTGESTYDREAAKRFMSTKTLKRKVNQEIVRYLLQDDTRDHLRTW